MRYSHQRELIIEILKNCKDHPTADVIYERARKKDATISLGTVYRNLRQLADSEKILTIETEDKKLHYDGDTSLHTHFICLNCHKVYDFFVTPKVPKEIEKSGFTVEKEKAIYYGKCKNCCEI